MVYERPIRKCLTLSFCKAIKMSLCTVGDKNVPLPAKSFT